MRYRPEIDGLRAIAVLGVLLFHFGAEHFLGGYAGVDVFFVISGYLISKKLFAELEGGRFSFASFFERRARRILPALFATIALTAAAARVLLFPRELMDFARAAIAAVLSASNVLFFRGTDYFDNDASQPLLHTWSLGVEEQFYLFFPVCFVFLHRRGRGVRGALIAMTAASLAGCAWAIGRRPEAAFYLPFFRAWEFLLGTLIATGALPAFSARGRREAASAAGLLVVLRVLSHAYCSDRPGLATIPACLGAALVLANAADGFVGRLLSRSPLPQIGLISYSLYLWHWPIYVFQRLSGFPVPGLDYRSPMAPLALTAWSLLPAWLSWRIVEVPFRSKPPRFSRKAALAAALAGGAALLAGAASILLSGGLPSRFASRELAIASYIDYNDRAYWRTGACFLSFASKSFADFRRDLCLREEPAKRNYLLIGDSHAAALWWGLSRGIDGTNVMQATAASCTPGLASKTGGTPACAALLAYLADDFLSRRRVDRLVLHAAWKPDDLPELQRTLAWARARGIEVSVIGPMPRYAVALPRLLLRSIQSDDPALPARFRNRETDELDGRMRALVEREGARYASALAVVCPGGACRGYARDDVPMQFDYGHLTAEGALLVARTLSKSGAL
ncbi:MAG TPA: acyltransferase family protein [Elusimicrobiota bacterium]|nr:acyltransferase family protein [Elusimicrobiota bacterium]